MNLQEVLGELCQDVTSGGFHTSPATRLFLFALAAMSESKNILETGYDAGYTTAVLAQTGATVTGVDSFDEYSAVKELARRRCKDLPNVKLIKAEAGGYLCNCQDESFDFVFIDDSHAVEHVEAECIELRRVLKPGGIAVFHDTSYHPLWPVVKRAFRTWEKINLFSRTPAKEQFNCGLAIVKKPNKKSLV